MAARGAVYSQRIPKTLGIAINQILGINQCDCQPDASVGSEQKPMLATSQHGSRSEEHNGAVEGSWKQPPGEASPYGGSGARPVGGSDVGLFDNPANGT